MSSLSRAYSRVISGISLLNENVDVLPSIPDDEVKNSRLIPELYIKYFVPGSGKASWSGNGYNDTWRAEFMLKFPVSDWSDGSEDVDTMHDYVEQAIKGNLPQSGGIPGEDFCRSYAIVVDEHTDKEFITVRCILHGGKDV